jgi:hypothetical protein
MDKRKQNGGHSTKAKGIDKRKNPYKDVVKEVMTTEKLGLVLNMLYNKAIDKEDTNAAKLLLEYSLGKPKETKDISITEIQPLFPDEL